MSRVDAEITIFTVSPIADPSRGGRWCSVQIWADKGTVRVRQLLEVKSRLLTPEERDPSAEVQEIIRAAMAIARGLKLAELPRLDTIAIGTDPLPVSIGGHPVGPDGRLPTIPVPARRSTDEA